MFDCEQSRRLRTGQCRGYGVYSTAGDTQAPRKRDSRTGASTAPHPRTSKYFYLFLELLCCRDFSRRFTPPFFSYFRTPERKNTVVYRVYMAPLYPHVRNVPRLGTAEAEPRGAPSLINGTSSRTCNRRPMSTNFSLFFSTTFRG